MHRLAASFVLAYHGCDKSTGDSVLQGESFRESTNEYDWLGRGVYFWEANPERGLEWAIEQSQRPKSTVKVPYVVGAIIEMGRCLDLTTKIGIDQLKIAYADLQTAMAGAMPNNGKDKLRRRLDCAVVNRLHTLYAAAKAPPIQTVKGVFTEGGEIYEGAGFQKKTHIQIAVIDPSCIKGVFIPRPYPKIPV